MSATSISETIRATLISALPHHLISGTVFHLTRMRSPLTPVAIRAFVRAFGVDMSEAARPEVSAYPTFNEFFIRALRPGARPLEGGGDTVVSPADGRISRIGTLHGDNIVQAKGQDYTALELLGGSESRAAPFRNGRFCTIYLSPRDYHRLHMPCTGTLREMVHVPGRLFTVAPYATRRIPRLFARNERVACIFDTGHGPMAMVLVGAINVAAIETVWSGLVTPPAGKRISSTDYTDRDTPVRLQRGAEMGRFNMGSTVVVLFPEGVVEWDPGRGEDAPVRMGRALGRFTTT